MDARAGDVTFSAVPLKHVAVLNARVLSEDTSPNFAFKYIDIGSVDSAGRITIPTDQTRFAAAPSRARRLAAPGATVISTVRTYLRAVGQVPHTEEQLVFSTGFAVAEAKGNVDRRFLAYACQTETFVDEVVGRSVGVSYPAINPSELGAIRLPLPATSEQRRIADFLDDQVARIDNIIAARREQVALIRATAKSQMQDLFDKSSTGTRPLATLADARRPIQYGIVLPGPDFPGGVPIVKGGDVAAGRVRSGQLNRTDPEIESRYARSRLRGGDLVISIRGSVGEVDFVPNALTGANLTQDAARIAPFGCDPDWLRWALELPTVQSDMRRRITGAMVPGINIEALRAVRVPDTMLAHQEGVGKAAKHVMKTTRHHVEGLDRSNSLMQKLKRSLITAAVTGEFDVSTADGSRVLG